MSYLSTLSGWQKHLSDAIDDVACDAMASAYSLASVHGKLPEEPDFVACLIKHGVPGIKNSIDFIFRGSPIKVATTGVFCHQSPMVKFNHAAQDLRCELGDLLFIHVHRDTSGGVYRNALLLQAKMTSPGDRKKSIPAAEQHQLALYRHWPPFTYDMKGDPLTGQSRTILPPVRHPGAQYLLIDSDPLFAKPLSGKQYPMAVWMAENPLYTHHSLGDILYNFLAMRSGRHFSQSNGAASWSEVVWDLIDNGLKKGFTRRRTGFIKSGRTAGDAVPSYACYATGHDQISNSIVTEILGQDAERLKYLYGDGAIPPYVESAEGQDDSEGGISLIIIETDESEM